MSSSLLEILQNQVVKQVIGSLENKENVPDETRLNSASHSAINLLLNGLMKNASNSNGLSALSSVLDKDHDGSILNDISGFMTGQKEGQRSANGFGILSHILGDKLFPVVKSLSNQNNISQDQSVNLLMKMAPLVLGSIGKKKRQENLDKGGLFDLLQNSAQSFNQKRNDNSVLENLLDRDGDGNVVDDVAGMGMKILGNLFRK